MKADNAVKLSKYKHLIKLLNHLKKNRQCNITFTEEQDEHDLSILASDQVFSLINRYIRIHGILRLVVGIVAGFLIGIFTITIIIPFFGTYVSSSDQGLIPPKYDALFSTKKPHEQAVQILTHEYQGEETRRGGPHKGSQIRFSSIVNDSATIELWFKLSKKSLITKISQKKGEEYIRSTVQSGMEKSGVDSAAKYYAGVDESNIAHNVSDAVSRTTAMKIEQGYLSHPVIRIIINGKDQKRLLTNFLPWEGKHMADFSINDASRKSIETMDYTKEKRTIRVPEPGEQKIYNSTVNEFIQTFLKNQD